MRSESLEVPIVTLPMLHYMRKCSKGWNTGGGWWEHGGDRIPFWPLLVSLWLSGQPTDARSSPGLFWTIRTTWAGSCSWRCPSVVVTDSLQATPGTRCQPWTSIRLHSALPRHLKQPARVRGAPQWGRELCGGARSSSVGQGAPWGMPNQVPCNQWPFPSFVRILTGNLIFAWVSSIPSQCQQKSKWIKCKWRPQNS